VKRKIDFESFSKVFHETDRSRKELAQRSGVGWGRFYEKAASSGIPIE
jgi:hypothetical protein